MGRQFRLAILSDIHYAGPREQSKGDDYELREISRPLVRIALQQYRRFIWLRYPLRQNGQLDRFLAEVSSADLVVANGDFTCDVAAVGVSDDDAFESVQLCLTKLREKFEDRFRATMGDHELGKLRLVGSHGGLRLESYRRATEELGIAPFWRVELGRYVCFGVTSTLIALPMFAADMLPEERSGWERLRMEHLQQLRDAFTAVRPEQRILFFCHDPTALPFLWRDEIIRPHIPKIERTIIGHLHSNLYLRASRWLSGMPIVRFAGATIQRMSEAVREARYWKPFNVLLCPSLAGIELLNDGGYFMVTLDETTETPAEFRFHSLKRPRWQ